ncbi:endonuclease/exonuclease/phosphatase family protein [Lacticaseibacillus kribbianus]|uniref:endonuclease/exonuclease/phosphatase family protein n=1 Tax=Lacticaseibacillus kribbianus TaxID=2926292 RepID=UPI001CD61294|nr:endonuclease/exonuclease/phosphatase family protein [Lacticaseibacillus kribbianus]
MKLMTYNIRYDNPEDEGGQWRWAQRRPHVIANIQAQAPDLLALQEVLAEPLAALKQALPAYRFVGVARDDGIAAGEFNGLFYLPAKFALIASGHQWLAQTPDQPTKFPGAGSTRIFQWARLRERATNRVFTAVVTHLDDQSQPAREQGMAQILRYFAPLLAAGEALVLAGDFNAEPEDQAYHQAVSALQDAQLVAKTREMPYPGTFQDNGQFRARPDLTTKRIDYWFVTPNVSVDRYQIDVAQTPDGHYASDHFPVVIDVTLEAQHGEA